MAENKILFLAALLVFAGSAAAVNIQVHVPPEVKASIYDVNYANSSSPVQTVNFTLENPASVGCSYYVRGRFQKGKEVETVFSKPYRMWPGEARLLELDYIPMNYTGGITADIDLFYCDKFENVTSFRFNSTSNNWINTSIDSQTIESNHRQANITLPFKNGSLIPIKSPSHWKTGSADIVNGSATIEYGAPIYRQGENLTYVVLDPEGNVAGKTEVFLTNPRPGFWERLMEQKWVIFAGMLVISLVGNVYLLRRKIVPEEVRKKLAELELEGRDIKK